MLSFMNKILFMLSFLWITVPLAAQGHYMNVTTFGILKGTEDDRHEAPLSFISEHHYRFNNRFSAGFMTGIEQLNENTLPASVSLRFYQPAKKCKFFLGGYAGYAVSLEKPSYMGILKATGGFMTGTETGMLIPVNSCASLIFGIGYRYNKLHYQLENYWMGEYKRNYTFNRLSLRIGIAF
jgi:hypothetical protein